MDLGITRCYQCGLCVGICPIGDCCNMRKLISSACFDEDCLDDQLVWCCTTCHMCEEMCPQGVDLMDFVILLRRLSAKRGVPTHTSRMLENIKDTGHVVSIKEKHEEMRISLGLNPRPEGDYKKISDEIRTILKEAER